MNSQQFCERFWFCTLTFSRFHQTDRLSGAGCPTHYVGQLIRGTAVLTNATETVRVGPGEPFFIPRGERYRSQWYPDDGGEVSWYSLGFDLAPFGRQTPLMQKMAVTDTARQLLQPVLDSLTVNCRTVGRLYSFLGEVADGLRFRSNVADPAADQAFYLIQQQPHRRIGEIAALCGVSESGLYGRFQAAFGMTPNTARQEALCRLAEQWLLTTDWSVEEISERLQFSSSSYFRKVLKARTGKTPRDIRRHHLV